jgi:hypothetical protein
MQETDQIVKVREAECVVLLRAVEDQAGDRSVLLQQNCIHRSSTAVVTLVDRAVTLLKHCTLIDI